ncbi:hypothetical protein CDD83_9252 [Cordyceps sp. RAO-2017]|nr:hypothetical protein CDD83_9252 [Cordyceps sp. RAO-2017]
MALPDGTESEPPSARRAFLRRILGKPSVTPPPPIPMQLPPDVGLDEPAQPPAAAQAARKVVTGLPRSQTFKRQQSEQRMRLSPITPSADERRATSADRRTQRRAVSQCSADPRASAPGLLGSAHEDGPGLHSRHASTTRASDGPDAQPAVQLPDDVASRDAHEPALDVDAMGEVQSLTTSQHEAMINDELERTWILNLSMHFRDRSKREKFFVTYREKDHLWRRVTISLDYRDAPPNSLEMDLMHTRFQREKSAKIYEAIRESLPDIKFYETVTNLKLETTDGRLHVHVVEDGNEIIVYPRVGQVRHLGCRRVKERDIAFDSHMSGFVYKVCVHGHVLIKKEIPSQDTIEEFLYEVNALNGLRFSRDVVRFYGVVVDDRDEYVKGLLISYASQGALIDIIYENCKENSFSLPWASKERWARQIIQGLADIHESGFVQGDFTLSNIVIDDAGDAKIIDINRRGCPVGWEPPEATALLETGHRITMYIGVKSDLYQLGMVLWGLAMEEDEPEMHGRPLMLGPEVDVPDWYRRMTEICLSGDPRMRMQASSLLQLFPPDTAEDGRPGGLEQAISVDDGHSLSEYFVEGYRADGRPLIRTVEPSSDWPYSGRTYVDTSPVPYELYYPTRGRSPPSPLPSDLDVCDRSRGPLSKTSWAANRSVRPSYTDVGADESMSDLVSHGKHEYEHEHEHEHETPTPTAEIKAAGETGDLSMARKPSEPEAAAGGRTGCDGADPADRVRVEKETSDTKSQAVAHGDDDGSDERWTAAPMPRLTREQTAFLTERPASAVGRGHMCGVTQASGRGSQAAADGDAADATRSHGCRDAGLGSQPANASGEDDEQVTQQRLRDDVTAGARVAGSDNGRRLPTAGSRDGGGGTEPEPEPEPEPDYVATQAADSTGSGARSHRAGGEAAATQTTAGRAANGWTDRGGATEVKRAGAGAQTPERPRQMALPVSLTGVGAAHMGLGDELMREKCILDDDFPAMAAPSAVPVVMMTADSPP